MDASRILRYSNGFKWVAIVLLPIVGYFAAQVRFGTAQVQDWLPGDDAARVRYSKFLERFGDDQILLMTWPQCNLDDSRLKRMSDYLRQLGLQDSSLGITDVHDSRSMLQELLQARSDLSEESALRRLRGISIGVDGSCFILMQLADAGTTGRTRLIETLQTDAEQQIGVKPEQLILAGEPYQVYVIDQASRETVQKFVAPSSLLALFVAWICLRQLRTTVLVFVLAGFGQLLGLAVIAIFVGEMSAVLVVLPTLIFMLTLSAAVHLVSYYRDCGGESVASAGAEALMLGARPCCLATLTTVCGFGSLAVSQLRPVWQFGSLASLGLLLSTACLLAVFPAASRLLSKPTGLGPQHGVLPIASGLTNGLAGWTRRNANAITAVGCLGLVLFSLGLTRLKTSTEFEDMFPPHSQAIESLHWVESHLGPISSLEFVISFPKSIDADNTLRRSDILEKVLTVQSVHVALEHAEQIASVMSAVTFLPPVPQASGTRSTIRRAVLRRTFEAHLSDLRDNRLVAETAQDEQWRVSARVRDVAAKGNFRQLQDDLSAVVQAAIAAHQTTQMAISESTSEAPRPAKAAFQVTGLRVVIEKAHHAILSDLSGSFLAAFLLIAPIMMLIVRGASGILLMIPNVLPVVSVFGCMGWLGIKLDVASILTASVALGIAVDDTLHFVTWFMRSRQAGHCPQAAVAHAINSCARPMLHTSIICTGSMLPFFFSDFLPTSKFALLLILILSGAIVGDLILLPAILQSPLGKMIGNQPLKNSAPPADVSRP